MTDESTMRHRGFNGYHLYSHVDQDVISQPDVRWPDKVVHRTEHYALGKSKSYQAYTCGNHQYSSGHVRIYELSMVGETTRACNVGEWRKADLQWRTTQREMIAEIAKLEEQWVEMNAQRGREITAEAAVEAQRKLAIDTAETLRVTTLDRLERRLGTREVTVETVAQLLDQLDAHAG